MAKPRPLLESVAAKLGGRKTLGATIASDADLARLVRDRLPIDALAAVVHGGFCETAIDRSVIPARTRRHRIARKERLTVDESDRLVRLARVQALAEDVFGDAGKANRWLRADLGILDGKPPIEVAQTEAGARVVEQLLAKIDWGAAA